MLQKTFSVLLENFCEYFARVLFCQIKVNLVLLPLLATKLQVQMVPVLFLLCTLLFSNHSYWVGICQCFMQTYVAFVFFPEYFIKKKKKEREKEKKKTLLLTLIFGSWSDSDLTSVWLVTSLVLTCLPYRGWMKM